MNVQVASANPVISSPSRNRVLLIDDNASIHGDFRKVLCSDVRDEAQAALAQLESDLFGETKADASRPDFEIDSAYQGKEGVEMARVAREQGRPYAMAFVDMRMPPGWDGLETIERLWQEDPGVQIVICSAHSDYDWRDIFERLEANPTSFSFSRSRSSRSKCCSVRAPYRASGSTSEPWRRMSNPSNRSSTPVQESWRPRTCSCAIWRLTMR